ncbi:MAG: integrase arm-type DNA-binding domain-containing protein [Novosphingobium sp.]
MLNRLTERTCATAKPDATRETRLFDGGGLYLAVRPTGAKAWKLKYSFRGAEKKLTLGPYPLLSLKEARAGRDRAKLQLAAGADPGEQKRASRRRARVGESFEAIARAWHGGKRATLTPRYAGQVLARLEANAFPALGAMAIGEITPADVLAAVRRIEARGALVMAQEVRGHISEVFVFAIASGLATSDPAAIIRKALARGGGGRRAALLTIEDARGLIAAIDAVRQARTATKLASRLLALTAVRPGVVRLAERPEFEGLDGASPLWRIPAAKMKLTLARKGDPAFDFVVPLSPQAAATARAAMAASDHPAWLFPGPYRRQVEPISDSTLSQLYLDAGYRGRHVPHGWRASFSTIMNERAAKAGREGDRAIIDLMLAHVKGDVEAAYNRASYMPRRRELAQEWADLLLEGLPPSASLLEGPRR